MQRQKFKLSALKHPQNYTLEKLQILNKQSKENNLGVVAPLTLCGKKSQNFSSASFEFPLQYILQSDVKYGIDLILMLFVFGKKSFYQVIVYKHLDVLFIVRCE
eukprot:TRINITY_DN26973_c0_g1_i3.p5 TRINITY_DN26973_c0_g1~~TRINITY_DN26973_c0_g1_i3.p5  ORF type:complete len:104 (-),score=1.90 TRINITY_DN26973_c0_g1_i3:27-338(-)